MENYNTRPPRIITLDDKNVILISYKKGGKRNHKLIDVSGLSQENINKHFIKNKKENKEIKEAIDRDDGLYDSEIEILAKNLLPEGSFLGIYSIDEIHNVKLPSNLTPSEIKNNKYGFIFNTDQSNGNGIHWISVLYDPLNQELDYYDSLGEEPTAQFLEEIKPVIDNLNLPYMLKFKINQIPRQNLSTNCGWHAIKFLYDRIVLDRNYKFASGYSEVQEGEKKIKNFKKFGFL